MAEVAEQRLTFEDYVASNSEPLYELVDGQLEPLPYAGPLHGLTKGRLCAIIWAHVDHGRTGAFVGPSLDIPTLPGYGRLPDLAYYSATDAAAGIDWDKDRVLRPSTLVAEVLAPGDEACDTVTKRREYALVGVPHYWLIDPQRRTALTLVLQEGEYVEAGSFSGDDAIVSDLFPGLEIPLARLFR